jgi:hypothetical protein
LLYLCLSAGSLFTILSFAVRRPSYRAI